MSQTGNGAMSMDEVEMLRSGYVMAFNRPGQGMVAVYDISRCEKFDSARHARVIMYINTVFSDEVTESEGFTIVYVVQSGKNPTQDLDPEGWKMCVLALPTRAKQLLVAQAFEEGKEGILSFLGYQTARTAEFRSKQQTERLISDSFSGTLALLEKRGVQRRYLPRCLGGDFDYEIGLPKWVRMRISIEDIMSPAPIKCNKLSPLVVHNGGLLTVAGAEGTLVATVTGRKKPARKKKPVAQVPNDESAKKLNALYSRRSYHRRKLEMIGLEEEVSQWKERNVACRKEEERLIKLLDSAKALISNIDATEFASLPAASVGGDTVSRWGPEVPPQPQAIEVCPGFVQQAGNFDYVFANEESMITNIPVALQVEVAVTPFQNEQSKLKNRPEIQQAQPVDNPNQFMQDQIFTENGYQGGQPSDATNQVAQHQGEDQYAQQDLNGNYMDDTEPFDTNYDDFEPNQVIAGSDAQNPSQEFFIGKQCVFDQQFIGTDNYELEPKPIMMTNQFWPTQTPQVQNYAMQNQFFPGQQECKELAQDDSRGSELHFLPNQEMALQYAHPIDTLNPFGSNIHPTTTQFTQIGLSQERKGRFGFTTEGT